MQPPRKKIFPGKRFPEKFQGIQISLWNVSRLYMKTSSRLNLIDKAQSILNLRYSESPILDREFVVFPVVIFNNVGLYNLLRYY